MWLVQSVYLSYFFQFFVNSLEGVVTNDVAISLSVAILATENTSSRMMRMIIIERNENLYNLYFVGMYPYGMNRNFG
jgi:hypothetical protein